MLKNLLVLTVLCTSSLVSTSQTAKILFKKKSENIIRKETEVTIPITIKMEMSSIPKDSLSLYSFEIKANDKTSTIAHSQYNIEHNKGKLDELNSEYNAYLTLYGDTASDRERHIYFFIDITKNGKSVEVNVSDTNKTLDLVITEVRALNKYNYLAYVGTNFDLVDGIKAQNLFFATSMFCPPQREGNGFGFNLTLYGNRTLTSTDTSGIIRYTSRIVGVGGDSAKYYEEEALKTTKRVTDNLGATFSPLIRLGTWSNPERITKIYLAPQFEFIWRRTQINTTYTEAKLVDSFYRANRPITGTLILTPKNETIPLNIYDVYLGLLGGYLSHENKDISIRFQASVGPSVSYISSNGKSNTVYPPFNRVTNWTCILRTWITEPVTGITFGAEVTNNLTKNYQPYFNVTLSKAINLYVLRTILQPLTSRDTDSPK